MGRQNGDRTRELSRRDDPPGVLQGLKEGPSDLAEPSLRNVAANGWQGQPRRQPRAQALVPASTRRSALSSVRERDSILMMIRGRNIVSALGVALRNGEIRRVQLAWGGAIAAEWAHFVALGVYAYEHGGTQAVGVAGLVRLLPAALIAPFAASLGDHFRRERFLLGMTLVGSGALAASAAASFAGDRTLVFAFAAMIGVSSTLFRPALQALLPSLARTPEELIASNGTTSMVESVGTLVGPVAAGVLVSVASVGVAFAAAGGTLLVSAALLRRVRSTGHVELTATAGETVGTAIAAGLEVVVRSPGPRLLVGLGVAQAFVRGCLNVLIVVAAFRVLGGG